MAPAFLSIPGVDVLEELGRGTHAVVYRVRRAGRYYAAKVPLGSPGDVDFDPGGQRFFREAMALARVRHRVLPRVMEVGRSGQFPYLVMELAAGETLADRLRRGPLEESQARELALELCDALVRIHDSGLVHRDITPSNILFDAPTTAVRLVDFGFAARAEPVRSEDCAPAALASGADTRGDLLALGCVLFECMTGHVPFAGGDPAPLLERYSGDANLQPRVSREFAAVLRRLLGVGNEAPQVDAAELLDDLKQLEGKASPNAASTRMLRSRLGNGAPVPLLGRDRELDRLRAARRVSVAGRTQVVLVRGARGSGKSRLLSSFAEELVQEHQAWFAVRCKPSQRTPFGVVRQILEALLEDQQALPPKKRLAAVAKLRAIAGEMAPLLRLLSPRLAGIFHDATPLPRDEGAEHIFIEGLTEFLIKLFADLGPTTVFVDDIQWLDAVSRRVVGRLADHGDSSVLYVLAARDDADSSPTIERLVRTLEPNRVWDLGLEPLDEDKIVELVRAYLAHEHLDPELVRFIVGLCDGTPLSAIETLRSMLEAGVLLPYWEQWRLDAAAATRMGLPRGSLELLSRRIAELEPISGRALATAAVIGMLFEDELVAEVSGVSLETTRRVLADARRGMLVESLSGGLYRFMHDSVREALLGALGEAEARYIHESIAEALEVRLATLGAGQTTTDDRLLPAFAEARAALTKRPGNGWPNEDAETARIELSFELAGHYLDGERTRSPERVLAACITAGRLAFRSYDNERALRYFVVASEAARHLGRELDPALQLVMAEAHLRTGAFDAGRVQLRRVVEQASDPVVCAYALSRIAWAEMQSDTERAWTALAEAFRVLGMRPLEISFAGTLTGICAWLRRPLRALIPRRTTPSVAERKRLAVLCDLYYQGARLAADTGKPALLVQSVLRGLEPAERIGASAALNKSYLIYSFVLTTVGARRAAERYMERAERIARTVKNPVVYAFTLQLRAVIAAWAGDVQEALRVGALSLDQYGHWRDLSDYAITAYNQQQIEGVRGRALQGWKWLDRAIAKISKHDGAPMVLDFLDLSARAALTSLGREHEADRLLSRLDHLIARAPARGAVSLMAYGSQVRLFTESGDLSEDFEALVRQVRDKTFDPKQVHLAMTEYYVHVAHARVHACLRAEAGEFQGKLSDLHEALKELRMASRMRLLRGHTAAVEAYYHHLSGSDAKTAERLFSEAELIGREEGAPWVLYAVYRGRAHMLRAADREEEARDQARLAETLAREHGAAYRLRWIREEFLLRVTHASRRPELASSSPPSPFTPAFAPTDSGQHAVHPHPRGYLRSLVRVGQCTAKELALERQVQIVLDELIQALRAERGYLFLTRSRLLEEQEPSRDGTLEHDHPLESERFQSTREQLALACAKSASGQALPDGGYDSKLVDDLWVFGSLDTPDDGGLPGVGTVVSFGDRSVAATSLVVRGGRLGVVYLDRNLRFGPFSEADARLLAALAGQVPLVLELARSLRARERAEETQRSAEKLEAIGRLAGGIAHDFNNMLSVILAASEQILSGRSPRGVQEDVLTVQSAAERARDLTRQLLAFSRGQYLKPEVFDLNVLIRRLEPIFRRLGNPAVTLEIRLEPQLFRVKADPAQIDQVLTNLVVNACDAMSAGGKLLIETSNVVVPDARVTQRDVLQPGRYARVLVSDTGGGMDAATRAKAFEPFFTTKDTGSGLGLATAYGIIAQSGGHIELDSQLGVGTSFRLFFPETVQVASFRPLAPAAQRVPCGSETILVVDDEPLVRESTRRMLSSLGYRVVTARSSEEALKIAAEHLDAIDLVISDVVMPGMNGLELARELGKQRPSVRVLFVSGFTAGVLTERGVFRETVEFLQKPIALETLATRIRAMLDPPQPDVSLSPAAGDRVPVRE